jgi:hypothetical protein
MKATEQVQNLQTIEVAEEPKVAIQKPEANLTTITSSSL